MSKWWEDDLYPPSDPRRENSPRFWRSSMSEPCSRQMPENTQEQFTYAEIRQMFMERDLSDGWTVVYLLGRCLDLEDQLRRHETS